MRPEILARRPREGGASLIVALIFLVVMAMLGVTIAGVTNLEERMAGNTRDRDIALQAAEAALRDAEARIAAEPALRAAAVVFDPERANSADFWEDCFESKASPCAAPDEPKKGLPEDGTEAVAEQPRYVIERKPDVGGTQIYLVTARSVGGTKDAIVVLQAEYGFTPP